MPLATPPPGPAPPRAELHRRCCQRQQGQGVRPGLCLQEPKGAKGGAEKPLVAVLRVAMGWLPQLSHKECLLTTRPCSQPLECAQVLRSNTTKEVNKVMKNVAIIKVALPGTEMNITGVTSNRAAAVCPACTRVNTPACSCVPEVRIAPVHSECTGVAASPREGRRIAATHAWRLAAGSSQQGGLRYRQSMQVHVDCMRAV